MSFYIMIMRFDNIIKEYFALIICPQFFDIAKSPFYPFHPKVGNDPIFGYDSFSSIVRFIQYSSYHCGTRFHRPTYDEWANRLIERSKSSINLIKSLSSITIKKIHQLCWWIFLCRPTGPNSFGPNNSWSK